MTPVKASKKENELRVWRNLYPDHLEIKDIKPKFSVGDKVIIRGSLTVTESKTILLEDVKVNIVVNGEEQVNHSIVKKSGEICSCTVFTDPVVLNQCDVINFISRTTNSKITNAYVSILIELDL